MDETKTQLEMDGKNICSESISSFTITIFPQYSKLCDYVVLMNDYNMPLSRNDILIYIFMP